MAALSASQWRCLSEGDRELLRHRLLLRSAEMASGAVPGIPWEDVRQELLTRRCPRYCLANATKRARMITSEEQHVT